MNKLNFTELGADEIIAIMQLTYQLIISAKQAPVSEEDDESINVMMRMLGFKTRMGNLFWNEAINFDPYKAFEIVSNFSLQKKEAFKSLILEVALIDNVILRYDVAQQIFVHVDCK